MGLDSMAEVHRDYWNPDRTDKLGYYAHECITMGWWTHFSAEIYQRPCPKDANIAVIGAAGGLFTKLKPEESAFDWAVTERFCSNMQATEADLEMDIEKEQKGDKSNEEWWVIGNDWQKKCDAMKRDLRKNLRAQVNRELSSATEADLAAIEELRERMAAKVAEEAA